MQDDDAYQRLAAEVEALRAENRQLEERLVAVSSARPGEATVARALLRSEAKNRAFLNAIPDLILQISREGTVLDYKPSRELGPYLPPSAFLRHNVRDIVPEEVAEQVLQHVELTLESGQAQIFEYSLPGRDGTRHYEARMVVAGRDDVLSVVRDISARKATEQSMIRSERLATLGLLAAALAHEINNPLQIIQSHLDLLIDFPLEPGEGEHYLAIVRHQIERLNAITRRVLKFANPEPSPMQPVSLTRCVRQILVLAGRPLKNKGVRVSTDFRPIRPVMAEADRLSQVMLNLLLNAIESVGRDGHIHVAVSEVDGESRLTVSNDGPPIGDDALAHIFEALYTTKPGGSGLGLWISQNLVQQYGGWLGAENLADGAGVRFTLSIPCADAATEHDAITEEP